MKKLSRWQQNVLASLIVIVGGFMVYQFISAIYGDMGDRQRRGEELERVRESTGANRERIKALLNGSGEALGEEVEQSDSTTSSEESRLDK